MVEEGEESGRLSLGQLSPLLLVDLLSVSLLLAGKMAGGGRADI